MPRLEMLENRTVPSTVHALFDPSPLSTPASGPFPSDRFTVADPDNLTGLRVNLPLPDPATHLSDYQDTQVLNTLDGFNLQPRLSIPFDGPIDLNTVTSQNIFLVSLGDTVPGGDKGGEVVGINQVVWDPYDPKTGAGTNTLYVESDQLLDQHTRYALIVTDGVRDPTGGPVQASEGFTGFRHNLHIGQAVAAAARVGVSESDIVTASVFTTQSATAVLEKIRDQIKAAPAPAVDFNLGPGGARTVFNLSDVASITFHQQSGVNPPAFTDSTVPISQLKIFPGVVSQVAYGKFSSPDYEVHPGEYIPAVGTSTGTPAVQGHNDIYFTLYLPSGTPPAGGWPVAIWGHGGTGSKDAPLLSGVSVVAATMAANGIATIGINAVGHGRGPLGTLDVRKTTGDTVTLLEGGRGRDQNGDGTIELDEGLTAASPREIISERDGRIQTAADLMQLVRVIEAGVDVDGNGTGDLDPSRVYYAGASLGAGFGALFLAVEPSVSAGVLNTVGGPIDANRLRPTGAPRGGRPGIGNDLIARVPPLLNQEPPFLNTPGITRLDGVAVQAPYFNENMPLRDGVPLTVDQTDGTTNAVIRSPVTNTVVGAMAIQELLENREWVYQPGSAVAYAPHLHKDPLPGVPPKSVIIQFARGDQTVPNPSTTAFLRAGDLADRATFYRYDLAYAESKQNMLPLPPANLLYPHTFALLISNPSNLIVQDVARGAQQQIAVFFATGVTIHPAPERFFETPIGGPLPEGLNFVGVAPQFAPVGAAVTASGGSNDVPILLNGGAWDGGGSIGGRVPDLPGGLLGLAFAVMITPDASAVGRFSAAPAGDRAVTAPAGQGEQSPVVSDAHGGVMDDALAAGTRPASSPGSDLFDAAVLDQVFADSAGSPAAPFLDGPGL